MVLQSVTQFSFSLPRPSDLDQRAATACEGVLRQRSGLVGALVCLSQIQSGSLGERPRCTLSVSEVALVSRQEVIARSILRCPLEGVAQRLGP